MKRRITIVEDDADILFILKIVLENAGYDVVALSTGKTIITGEYQRPDLFILDKRMPDMDGLDLCRHLRNNDQSKAIPIIVVSASPKFGPLALAAGANGFLAKPFEIKDLLEIVARHLT